MMVRRTLSPEGGEEKKNHVYHGGGETYNRVGLPPVAYWSDIPGPQRGCSPEGSSHCRSLSRSSRHLVDPVGPVGLEDQGDPEGL